MLKENVYSTICPGCGLACGLYIRETVSGSGEAAVSVDFRKNSPVNAGKLCRFGMKLPRYYSEPPVSKAEGKEAAFEEAVSAAARALKAAPEEGVAFLSVGNTTNEEQLTFAELAAALGTGVETGMGIYASFPAAAHAALSRSGSLEQIESAKQVFLFIDPYVSYPLVLRRVLKAKENGAKVISVGAKKLPLADENLCLKPREYRSALSPVPGSVLVADIHPYSDPEQVKAVLDLARGSGAKPFFLRPFANSAGAGLLAKHTWQRTLEKLLKDIDAGKIKTLFCLNSDLLELAPDPVYAKEVLSKLDTLIVQASRGGKLTELADIVIAAEPFYRKRGTVLNSEGRLLANGASSTRGFEALAKLAGAFGRQLDFESVQSEVFGAFGLEAADEFTVSSEVPIAVPCEVMKAQGSDPVLGSGSNSSSGSVSDSEPWHAPCSGIGFVYSFNPFMWHGVEDDNNFVELNLGTVQKLGLVKGGTVRIKAPGGQADMRFRVSDVADGFVLSSKKLPRMGFRSVEVELSR